MLHGLLVDLAPARAATGLDVRLLLLLLRGIAVTGEHNLDLAEVPREVEDDAVVDR